MPGRRGYTIVEATVAIALISFSSSAAIIQLKNSLRTVDADVAAATVASQLKYAREIAVHSRCRVQVEFINPGTIRITKFEANETPVVITTTAIPSTISFALPAGIVDTPEGYGNAMPVNFGRGSGGNFQPDGIFTNSDGIVTSGTVFTLGPGGNDTARAVTLAGSNGRVRQYQIRNNTWIEKTH